MTADKVNAGFSFLVNVYSEILNAIKMKKSLVANQCINFY